MFAPANQPHFNLAIRGLSHDFKVLEFTGHEALCRPYRFELDLVSEIPDLDIESFLHKPAFLAFAADGTGVHGLIHSIAQGEAGKRLTRYRITLECYRAALKVTKRPTPSHEQRWFTVEQLVELPLNTTGRKVALLLGVSGDKSRTPGAHTFGSTKGAN